MCLAVLFEINQKTAPVTKLGLVTVDHILTNLVAFNTRGGAKRGNAIASIDAVQKHHVGNRSLRNASGSSSPAGMNCGNGSSFGISNEHRQTVRGLDPK